MLEINSEWYGKTVYFRVHGAAGTGVAINVPAYTELETDGNGNYVEAASGTRYKRAIAFLNAFVPDAQSMYKNFLNQTTSDGWLLGQDENGNPTSNTKDMHIRTYIVNCDVYSGWHAINSYPNYTYSTTGNITAVRATALQNARAHNYSCSVKINSVTAYIKEDVTVTKNPVYAAVIEYVPQSLNMAITDHSATDDAVIGTNAILPEEKPGQIVVDIDGDAKVYDGTPIYPSKFEVSGPSGANRSLFDITYTAVEPGNYADYTDTTVRGGNYQESGAVNATRYHAKLTLTQESIDAGWVIDELNSQC